MFVCYQTSIPNQFEFIQSKWANNPKFIFGKVRPPGGSDAGKPVDPGFDPIIGQSQGGSARHMDEPVPNYPTGSERSTLNMPNPFVVPTAGAYFFVLSISALRAVLT
jgi:deferrochelatase/peroxidase EfeB